VISPDLPRATPHGGAASWLAVVCGGQGLLFPLQGAGEIFPLPELLKLPHTRPWFAGVANLRGSLHGVVDLAAFLGLPPARQGSDAPRVLALNPAVSGHCAVLLDALTGLRSVAQMAPEPQDAGPRPGFALRRWRDEGGRVWQELDLAALAANEQFLDIAEPTA